MSLTSNLFKNTGAGVFNRISGAFFRLVQVPLLLSALGVEEFGRWLVLSSLPTWLMLANMGFGSVAANEISMAVAANDLNLARKMFSTTLALVVAIGGAGAILSIGIIPLISWETFLKVPEARHNEIALTVIWLAFSVFLFFSIEAFGGRFRAARKAHLSVLLSATAPWIDFFGLLITVHVTKRLDYLAMSLFLSTICFYIINWWVSWLTMPQLAFSWKDVEPARCRFLFKKGAAFQAFPLGNAMLFQGSILVVQAIIGPVGVAIFGTARTVVRTVNQLMEIINQAIWPELSHLFGKNDFRGIVKLHRAAVGISITLSSGAIILFAFFGQSLYSIWVGKNIVLPQHLFFMFLLPIPFNALWFTSSVIHVAGNQHEGLAIRYLFAAVLAIVACGILSCYFGIEGAALSTIVADLILIPYVLKHSLLITNDTVRKFACGIVTSAKDAVNYFAISRTKKNRN